MADTFAIVGRRPRRSGSLRGYVSATMPSGLVLHEISVFVTNGKAWCSPPGKPLLDRDGMAMVDAAGKRRYSPIVDFKAVEIRNRWSEPVITALLAAHQDAVDE